jgi:hypothetical protein
MSEEKTYVDLWDARVVTPEIINIIWGITEAHFPAAVIDWDEVWEQIDGIRLADGRIFEILPGASVGTPTLIAIKQTILWMRREEAECTPYGYTSFLDVKTDALDALDRALSRIQREN